MRYIANDNKVTIETITLSIKEWLSLSTGNEDSLPPVWIHVVTGSMLPLIRPFRDKMLLAAVPLDSLKVGDIVLSPAKTKSGDYRLHRLYKINGNQVQTMGDCCKRPDRWFPKENIFGKVLIIHRGRCSIDCDSRLWLIIARIWMLIWPVRPLFLIVYRVFRKVFR